MPIAPLPWVLTSLSFTLNSLARLIPAASLPTIPHPRQPLRRAGRAALSTTRLLLGNDAACFRTGDYFFRIVSYLIYLIPLEFRSTVSALVIGTSGASYAGFKTAAEAYEDYFNAKAQGYVRVVRDYGDEAIFGPLSLAIM